MCIAVVHWYSLAVLMQIQCSVHFSWQHNQMSAAAHVYDSSNSIDR